MLKAFRLMRLKIMSLAGRPESRCSLYCVYNCSPTSITIHRTELLKKYMCIPSRLSEMSFKGYAAGAGEQDQADAIALHGKCNASSRELDTGWICEAASACKVGPSWGTTRRMMHSQCLHDTTILLELTDASA